MDIKWIGNMEEGMTLHRKYDLLWLDYAPFREIPWLTHGFSTRFGGVSRGCYASMNLDRGSDDDPAAVRTNFERIASAIGFPVSSLVFARQTHTANVRKVRRSDRGSGLERPVPWTDVDGLITNAPGVTLVTVYADCVPLYFVDPINHAIGLSHSGWRGTAAGIGRVTIEAMQQEFGSEPSNMYAAIGPSICKSCYEVGEEVAKEFPNCYVTPKANGKYLLDLQGACRGVIAEAGVPLSRILMPNLCTCCNPDLFYSHRAMGKQRGEMAAFLGIREDY